MDPGQRCHRAGGTQQVHTPEILAVLRRKRCEMLCDLPDHPRIGLPRNLPAAEMFGQRNDAKRDRHPRLDARNGILLARVALDPNQLRRSAPDVEQNGAPPLRIEQRRAADHGKRRLGFAVDHFQADAGLGRDPVPEAVGICRRATSFGCDQSHPLGLLRLDLVAANTQGGDGAFDRGIADKAGRRNPLPQADDPRE